LGGQNEREKFERGIAHFNAGEFFEAHEVWEELWLRAPAEEKPFLQGIIQIAAAFHHFKNGNLSGARSLLAAGLAKTGQYSAKHGGIDLGQLRGQGHSWLQALEMGDAPAAAKLPQIHRVTLGS
jgi:predicted metal-dependent hydrolase